jgi:hypothetical protein
VPDSVTLTCAGVFESAPRRMRAWCAQLPYLDFAVFQNREAPAVVFQFENLCGL